MESIECPWDDVLQEDIENIVNNDIMVDVLNNCTILVTGATGLIGSLIVKTLACYNRIKNTNINIIALVKDETKANQMFKDILNRTNIKLHISNIISPIVIEEDIDYIIHGASITSSHVFITKPVETIQVCLDGTKNILELAKAKRVKGLVYLSSMEVYGITDPQLDSVCEENLGYIDILSVRSSYSESKRMAECLCNAYVREFEIPIRIARLSQTFGAGVSIEENRVFGQFALSAISNKDIILHTNGTSSVNYCYTRDAIKAIMLLVTKGESGEAYNITNEKSNVTIRDMANMIAEKIANNRINVVYDIPDNKFSFGYPPITKMKLNSRKMQSLGWSAEIGLEESYKRMIRSMNNTIQMELYNV